MPGGRCFNEIDYICISKRWSSCLSDVRVRRGADDASDHYLLCGNIKIKLKKQKVEKKKTPINLNKLKNPETAKQFQLELKSILSKPDEIQDTEEIFTKTVLECATKVITTKVIGKKKGKRRE